MTKPLFRGLMTVAFVTWILGSLEEGLPIRCLLLSNLAVSNLMSQNGSLNVRWINCYLAKSSQSPLWYLLGCKTLGSSETLLDFIWPFETTGTNVFKTIFFYFKKTLIPCLFFNFTWKKKTKTEQKEKKKGNQFGININEKTLIYKH